MSFLEASRMKVRFDTAKGFLSVEDLWDLPLDSGRVNLDDIAIELSKQLKDTEESFVRKPKRVDPEIKVKFDVVKAVIETRLQELDALKVAREKAERKQKIMEIIGRKEDKVLEEASLDELKATLASL